MSVRTATDDSPDPLFGAPISRVAVLLNLGYGFRVSLASSMRCASTTFRNGASKMPGFAAALMTSASFFALMSNCSPHEQS